MPKRCGVCQSSRRQEIDEALIQGMALREAEKKFGHSKSQLGVHKRHHIAELVARAKQEREQDAGKLVDHLNALQKAAFSILKGSLEAGDSVTALMAIREARANTEAMAKLILKRGAKADPARATTFAVIFEGGRPVTKELPVGGQVVEKRTVQ